MATIRTALSLYDGMTGPLRKINAAMRVLIPIVYPILLLLNMEPYSLWWR